MCGIAGIVNLNQKFVQQKEVESMIYIAKHRGPDDQGFCVFNNVGLGHCRLSILDLSSAGHQPMPNNDKSLWIVFNGEIYNYLELKKELEALGYIFKSQTDTEVILNAYHEWGEACLNKFNGMWAFAILDIANKKLFCARDRFGVKPFYYALVGEAFIFGSEIKQLLATKKIFPKANDKIIYNYLSFGIENYNEDTFFEGVKQLLGGYSLSLELKEQSAKPIIRKWYKFFEKDNFLSDNLRTTEHFLELLTDAVKIRLRSDVPVGSCLSGGIDSSSIVCFASRFLKIQRASRQETFTACFNGTSIDEREYANEVIKKTGCIGNFVFPSYNELIDDLENLIWHQEEPFGSLSVFSQWRIMSAAKEKNIKVLLDGQGGDELMLGYERYYSYFLKDLLRASGLKPFVKELLSIAKNSKLGLVQLIQYYFYFSYPSLRLWNTSRRVSEFINRDFLASQKNEEITSYWDFCDTQAMQKKEIFQTQLPHLLRYEDRNSMAHSVETRLPFLDYRMVEFIYSLPIDQKIHDGWTKYILRIATKGVVPDSIRWRKRKMGFEVPQDAWLLRLKKDMRDRIGCRANPYINNKKLKQIADFSNHSVFLWRIYNLELWMERFNIR